MRTSIDNLKKGELYPLSLGEVGKSTANCPKCLSVLDFAEDTKKVCSCGQKIYWKRINRL